MRLHPEWLQRISHRSSRTVIRIRDPVAYNNNILLGRITKVSGYEGAVTIKLEKYFSEDLLDMESVFLVVEGKPVPFFISDSEYTGADILKLKFNGYNSVEKVSEFVGCSVFFTVAIPVENKIEDIKLFIGFNVLNPENISIGTIQEVVPNRGQWLLIVISASNKEILIPLHEHFIVKIDKNNKQLIMDIPDGLTEIN
jgi:16S rRNA processing protein RimM